MTECYHNEALRKQRVIDRAAEARERLEKKAKKKYSNKGVQVGSPCFGDETKNSSKRKHYVEKKLDCVRRDLRKQELVLRDSNLVMGKISAKEELALRKGKH